jgi:protein TonB
MTTAAPALSRYLPRPTATGRIRLALAVSAFFHLLLAFGLASEMRPRSGHPEGVTLITARIELLPWSEPARVTAADKEESSRPPPGSRAIADTDEVRRETAPKATSGMEQGATRSPALLHAPDLTVYTARDLDSYPRPVFPLDIEGIAERAAGFPPAGVRLELLIDEQGIVNDVALAGPETAGQRGAELRAALAATRFIPARRDGRAVRSRVLLNINLAPAGESKVQP